MTDNTDFELPSLRQPDILWTFEHISVDLHAEMILISVPL